MIQPVTQLQIYARRKDLIPTESPIIKRESFDKYDNAGEAFAFATQETRCPNLNAAEYYHQFLKDLKFNETTDFSLYVHPNRVIADGNFRFHWARWAGLEFLPISLDFLLCDSTAKWMVDHMYTQRGSMGKERTITPIECHLKPGYDQWWLSEAREFLSPFIKWGAPPPEFNLSYEECVSRLKA